MADFAKLKNYPVATGAQINTPDDVAALVQAGVQVIIDCQAERDDSALLASSTLPYLWDPRGDDGQNGPQMDSWWKKGLDFASSHKGQVVYSHCAAGINRGPSMAYGILRMVYGLSPQDAEAAIREVRPQVGIAYKADFERYFSSINSK